MYTYLPAIPLIPTPYFTKDIVSSTVIERFPHVRGSLMSDVPSCQWFPHVRCSLMSDVPSCQMFPHVSGSLMSDVPSCQMFPHVRCSLMSDVPSCQMFPHVRCSLMSEVVECMSSFRVQRALCVYRKMIFYNSTLKCDFCIINTHTHTTYNTRDLY